MKDTYVVYAHWVPDTSTVRAVDLLDETQPKSGSGGVEKRAKSLRENGEPVATENLVGRFTASLS
jgi:hypothetical protein